MEARDGGTETAWTAPARHWCRRFLQAGLLVRYRKSVRSIGAGNGLPSSTSRPPRRPSRLDRGKLSSRLGQRNRGSRSTASTGAFSLGSRARRRDPRFHLGWANGGLEARRLCCGIAAAPEAKDWFRLLLRDLRLLQTVRPSVVRR